MFDKITESSHDFKADIHKDMTVYAKDGKPIESNVLAACRLLSDQDKERELDSLMKNHHICKCLPLKKGAQVMCTRNLDLEHQICNGSQGIVIDIVKDRPLVLFSNGHRMLMEKTLFQSEVYPTLVIGQYPLTLAWAVTIHKIQGCSLSHAQIDIGESIFEYGQTYVALSRVRTMDGLYLMNFQPKRIKSHPKVIAFYNSL
jgi:ATP-dependent DNA helicase PIF1